MMHDSVASFYGGYDQTGVGRLPNLRIPAVQLAIGVAVVSLLVLVATDISAIDNQPATVQVASVNWYAESAFLTTSAGFTVHASQSFTLGITCQAICYNFNGATVNAPFQVVGFSTVSQFEQFTNVTIRAPSSSYDGSLTITLGLG